MIPLYNLPADAEGFFLERINRFVGKVKVSSSVEMVHIYDPGRLPQLLIPGNRLLLKKASNPFRKTRWTLLAARFKNFWVFTNSFYHRHIAEKILKNPDLSPFPLGMKIIPEPKVEKGRLDFFLYKGTEKIFIEIKGCTWAQGSIALFPDAPTSRGLKHIKILLKLKEQGFRACLWFFIFRPETTSFLPAEEIDPLFSHYFFKAQNKGIEIIGSKFLYDGKRIYFLETKRI